MDWLGDFALRHHLHAGARWAGPSALVSLCAEEGLCQAAGAGAQAAPCDRVEGRRSQLWICVRTRSREIESGAAAPTRIWRSESSRKHRHLSEASVSQDITGEWNGTFAYPADTGPATPFVAKLLDIDGKVSGSIIEPHSSFGAGLTLVAEVQGVRAGYSVDFTKVYNDPPSGYEKPVDYVGKLSDDGSTISGVWSLLDMNGTFEMHREIGESIEIEREETVEVS